MLKTILYPAVRKFPPPNYKPAIGDQITMSWLIEKIEPEEAIEGMYKKAVDMGANALIRFEIKPSPIVSGVLTIQGIEATGFAIKRKPIEVNISK